jgi:GNAT superfamily N-acetyltransferase
MEAEMDTLYGHVVNGQPASVRAAVDAVLAVDPLDVVVTVLALDSVDGAVLGHAALRRGPGLGPHVLEVKKVIVATEHRGRGVSRFLMAELEAVGREHGATSLVLQTGDLQLPAIRLYEASGYLPIPVYGGYAVMSNALCYAKAL